MSPLVITTAFRAGPFGWELKATSAPFASNQSGARPTWLLPGGDVLVGPANNNVNNRDVATYTPGTDSWTSKNDFSDSGSPDQTPSVYNVAYGGVYDPISGNPLMSFTNADPAPDQGELFEYLPGSDEWIYRGDWPDRNRSQWVTTLNSGEIFIASTAETANRDRVEKWDGTTFTSLADIPQPFAGSPTTGEIRGLSVIHTADNGIVYMFGGQQWPVAYSSDAIWKYDPVGNSWSLSSVTIPTRLRQMNSCRLTGNRALIIGGTESTPTSGGNVLHREVYIFDFATETFELQSNLFAEPEVPGGVNVGYHTPGSQAIQLTDGKVMVLYNDNEVYITTQAV